MATLLRMSRPYVMRGTIRQGLRSIAASACLCLALACGRSFAAPAHSPRPFKLVALGDSLTAGYGLAPGQAFPKSLEQALKADGLNVEVVNAGVSGDTASDGLARLAWSFPDDANGAIVELGANDMLRGIDPAATEAALAGILEWLKQKKIPVLLAGMYASPTLGKDYVFAFQAIYPKLAQSYGATFYPFFLQGVAGDQDLLQSDGMHPNDRGVRKIVELILPVVESFVAKASLDDPRGRQ